MYGNEDLKGMGKTVVMFPGQGSQCTGMGRESYNSCTSSVKCFKKAGELTGINMEHLIFEENDLLDKTEYTQIALYVTEISQLADMVEQGLTYDAAIATLWSSPPLKLAISRLRTFLRSNVSITSSNLFLSSAFDKSSETFPFTNLGS